MRLSYMWAAILVVLALVVVNATFNETVTPANSYALRGLCDSLEKYQTLTGEYDIAPGLRRRCSLR